MDTYIISTEPIYISDRDHCGYCECKKQDHYALESLKPQSGSTPAKASTIGLSIEHMTSQDYDEFINKGFRRSGSFLYKPDNLRNCCRYYTIRTSYSQFKLSKKHRKVVNRFMREIGPIKEQKNGTPYDLSSLVEAEKNSKSFHTRFEPSLFSEEKFELYKKYQTIVHNDDPDEVSETQFERFLCDTPFSDEEINGNSQQWDGLKNWRTEKPGSRRVGPTHECYYLNNKLIAFSVTDFLPSGISSIYFVWDPDYAHLSLGTISGIRELLMLKYMDIDYYYLGYYIEDCPKMVYKNQFGGELLDLANETYFPLEQVSSYIKNTRLFVMGDENSTKEIPMTNEFPVAKSQKQGKFSDNVASSIYNDTTFQTADEAAKRLAKLLKMDFNLNFPKVIPGLMPLPQLVQLFEKEELKHVTITFFHMYSGRIERDKPLSGMTNKEKVATINCMRLFGIDKLHRLAIVTQ